MVAASLVLATANVGERALVAAHPTWEVIVRSFASKGLLALPPGLSIDDVLGRAEPGR